MEYGTKIIGMKRKRLFERENDRITCVIIYVTVYKCSKNQQLNPFRCSIWKFRIFDLLLSDDYIYE